MSFFKKILFFLYTGKIDLNSSNVVQILESAIIFNIQILKEKIIKCFWSIVTEDNVLKLLSRCQETCPTIANLCFEFITKNYSKL